MCQAKSEREKKAGLTNSTKSQTEAKSNGFNGLWYMKQAKIAGELTLILNCWEKCSKLKKTHTQTKKISLSAVRWRRHRAVFRNQFSIKATYYAYYFGWLYSNFNHNRKQSKPWSVPSENYTLFMFLAAISEQPSKICIKKVHCFVAYMFFLTSTSEYNQVPVRFSGNYFKQLYQNAFQLFEMLGNTFKISFLKLQWKNNQLIHKTLKQI